MIGTLDFSPDRVSPPGDTIIDLMDEYGLTDAELSKKIGLSVLKGQQLLQGHLSLNECMALKLQDIFDVSVDFWLKREGAYREHIEHLNAVNKEWLESLPVKDMVNYGWIPKASTKELKFKYCLDFFEIKSVNDFAYKMENDAPLVAFRKSLSLKTVPMADLAWIIRAKKISNSHACNPWSKEDLIGLLPDIRRLSNVPNIKKFAPQLKEIFAKAGVSFIVLPAPSGCRASGATCFFEPNRPTLIVSFRHLTDDHFWFTLFHEIGHLILHDAINIRIEGETELGSKEEDEADQFAIDTLIPKPFQGRVKELRSKDWKEIMRIAKKIGISRGIVVGHLQHIGNVPYSHLNRLKVRYKKDDII